MEVNTEAQAPNSRRVLSVIGAALFLAQTVALMLGPLLVDLADEFDTSLAVAGQLAAATFAAWAIGAPLVGPVSDSLGRRPVALMGLFLMSAGTLGSAFAPTYGAMLGLRIVTGLGGAMIPPNSMAAVADVLPPSKRATAVGWLVSVSTLASVLGIPAVAALASAGGWHLPFLIIGALLLTVLALSWKWFPRNPATRPRAFPFFSRYKLLGSNPAFLFGLLANFTQRMVFFAVFSYLAAYLIDNYHKSTGETAIPLALVGIGAVVGSMAGGLIAGRTNRLSTVALCVLGGGFAASLLFTINAPLWATVTLAFGAISLLSTGWPVFITVVSEISGRSRATGVGVLGASNQLGGVGGAALGGVMLGVGGFPLVGIFCLAAAIVSAALMRLKMQEPTSASER